MRKPSCLLAVLLLTLAAASSAATPESQTTLIPIQSFVPVDDQQQYTAMGAQYGYLFPRVTGASVTFWAPLGVPVGVQVDSICLFVADGSNATEVTARLVISGVTTSTSAPLFVEVAEASSGVALVGGVKICLASINPGFAFPWLVRTSLPGGGFGDVVQYFLRVTLPPYSIAPLTGPSAVGPGIVTWRRAISDAPGTATFDDVGTGDAYFQYVEALSAAGVMTSCDGGDNFCPDAPVTRKQLALFLARALGVYWPD